MIECETIIIGGGPSGSACAWELARSARECMILESPEAAPADTSAGWIQPKVLRDLEVFSPGDYPHGLLELREVRLYVGRCPWSIGIPTRSLSLRRREFDDWLRRRCAAPLVPHRVGSIRRDGPWYEIDDAFRCRNLVGAAGAACPVKRAFFPPDDGRLALMLECEFESRALSPRAALFRPLIGTAGCGWYLPKRGAVNVGFGGFADRLERPLMGYWPGFVELLRRRGLLEGDPPAPMGRAYRAGGSRRVLRCGNAYAIGDAAGLATAEMCEGVGAAVESGIWTAWQIRGLTAYTADMLKRRTSRGLLA